MKNGPLLSLAVMLVATLFSPCASAQKRRPTVTLATSEVSLGSFLFSGSPASLTVSPDRRRMAYWAERGDKLLVVVDGVEGREYDGIGVGSLLFSPDGKRMGYGARRGNKWVAVVDGAEGNEYDLIGGGGLVFSPDGRRVAHAVRRGDKWLVVVDGAEGKEYDRAGEGGLIFSPDSQRVAYPAVRGDKWLVIVDGVEGKEYDGMGVGDPVFSPDGKRVAYAARREDKGKRQREKGTFYFFFSNRGRPFGRREGSRTGGPSALGVGSRLFLRTHGCWFLRRSIGPIDNPRLKRRGAPIRALEGTRIID